VQKTSGIRNLPFLSPIEIRSLHSVFTELFLSILRETERKKGWWLNWTSIDGVGQLYLRKVLLYNWTVFQVRVLKCCVTQLWKYNTRSSEYNLRLPVLNRRSSLCGEARKYCKLMITLFIVNFCALFPIISVYTLTALDLPHASNVCIGNTFVTLTRKQVNISYKVYRCFWCFHTKCHISNCSSKVTAINPKAKYSFHSASFLFCTVKVYIVYVKVCSLTEQSPHFRDPKALV
jgi:hypothetical protein